MYNFQLDVKIILMQDEEKEMIMDDPRDKKGQYLKGAKKSTKHVEFMKEAQKGNQHAIKLTTSELKQEAFKQYCNHLATGKKKESWCFDHPDLTLTCKTMEKYIAEDPNEFPIHKKDAAFCKGYQYWESIVEASASGINKDANTATLQMLMRNKFGWDKQEVNSQSSSETHVEALTNKWRKEAAEKKE